MGYDVHITRKAFWHDDEGPEISLQEWLDYVEVDPEMRFDGGGSVAVGNGAELGWQGDSTALWTAWSRHGVDQGMAWMCRSHNGVIVMKNPDKEQLSKMHRIASVLYAKVQGDEEEFYGPDGNVLPIALQPIDPNPSNKPSGFLSRLFKVAKPIRSERPPRCRPI